MNLVGAVWWCVCGVFYFAVFSPSSSWFLVVDLVFGLWDSFLFFFFFLTFFFPEHLDDDDDDDDDDDNVYGTGVVCMLLHSALLWTCVVLECVWWNTASHSCGGIAHLGSVVTTLFFSLVRPAQLVVMLRAS